MKRPKYDGIRFYSVTDLSSGVNSEKTTKLLKELNVNKEYQDINEVIELYKAYQLIFADGIKDEYIKDYKTSANNALGIVAKFFKKIDFNLALSVAKTYGLSDTNALEKLKTIKNVVENNWKKLA